MFPRAKPRAGSVMPVHGLHPTLALDTYIKIVNNCSAAVGLSARADLQELAVYLGTRWSPTGS